MKRLKYACPFGGKHYPFLITFAVGTAVLFPCIFNAAKLSGFLVIFYPLLAAAVVLAGCFWWEQRLTRDEERLCNDAPVPLWSPLTPELTDRVRKEEAGMRVSVTGAIISGIIVGGFLALLAFTGILDRQSTVLHPELFLPFFLIGALGTTGALFLRGMLAATWEAIDETAVYTAIPIHHMYDVEEQSSNGRGLFPTETHKWHETYYVCYLPDGRYVLHAKYSERGNPAREIVVIKFRGHLRWHAQ